MTHRPSMYLLLIILLLSTAYAADSSLLNSQWTYSSNSNISKASEPIDSVMEVKGLTAISSTLVVASTDLTNLNKSKYSVYYDLSDPSIKAGVNSLSNKNLCDIKTFKKSAGEFTCSKDISYTVIYDPNKADIYITDNPKLYVYGKKLLVYIGDKISDGDSIPIKFIFRKNKDLTMEVDTKQLKAQGFVPDPLLKIEK